MSTRAIPLYRYAQRIGYRETAFFGINHPDNDAFDGRQMWNEAQRTMVLWALDEAQSRIELQLGFTLLPTWQSERVPWANILKLSQQKFIAGGVELVTTIGTVVVDYTNDPAEVLFTTTEDIDTVHFYLADTDEEVVPTSIVEQSTDEFIAYIPWSRLVAPAYKDNPSTGLDYNDEETWGIESVDIVSITNDTSTQATVTTIGCAGCSDTTVTARLIARDATLGFAEARRATYASGAWTDGYYVVRPTYVDVYYQAGDLSLARVYEDAIIRLAHSAMPEEACGNIVTQHMWARDTKVPELVTRERINCPFGMSDGAWYAWTACQAQKVVRGTPL